MLNVLTGERYKSISRETAGVLKGEYGATPAPVDAELQARVLEGGQPVTCRPADLLEAELDVLGTELQALADEKGITLTANDGRIDDVLTYALFPQVGLKFLENRGNPDAFEPVPGGAPVAEQALNSASTAPAGDSGVYTVKVNGRDYVVEVSAGGDVERVDAAPPSSTAAAGESIPSPLAGNIVSVNAAPGEQVSAGEVNVILEAMKMETEVRASKDGTIATVCVKPGDVVAVGDALVTLA